MRFWHSTWRYVAASVATLMLATGCIAEVPGSGPTSTEAPNIIVFPLPAGLPGGLPPATNASGDLLHTLIFDFDTLPTQENIMLTFTAAGLDGQAVVIPWASDEGPVGVGPRITLRKMPWSVGLIFPDTVEIVSVSMTPTDIDGDVDPDSPNIVAACRIVEQTGVELTVVDTSEAVWARRDFGDPDIPLLESNSCVWFNSSL